MKDSPEYAKIEEAITLIDTIVQYINDSSAITQNFKDVVSLEGRLLDYKVHFIIIIIFSYGAQLVLTQTLG